LVVITKDLSKNCTNILDVLLINQIYVIGKDAGQLARRLCKGCQHCVVGRHVKVSDWQFARAGDALNGIHWYAEKQIKPLLFNGI